MERLVDGLAEVIKAGHAASGLQRRGPHGMALPAWVRLVASLVGPQARHALLLKHCAGYAYNLDTHEKDLFSQADVQARVGRWSAQLSAAGVDDPPVRPSAA